jgi:3-hydroxyacyl-CoA dehydrogenase/enoyl-CoA hydratase/3-hydroxybutyryl-CoA epimerase
MATEVAAIPERVGGVTRVVRIGDIAWLALDDPAKKVNTLSTRLFAEFEDQIAELESDPPEALVIVSGKPEGFVAGADLEELARLTERGPILAMLQRGHELMERLAGLPFPTVAAIHGACLGGGLELALACGRRVATQHPKTKLGLPEVQLGLIPGLGGTQRLPRLIGVPDALDLILTGKQVDARKAKRLGLVDNVCHPADLRQAAERLARLGRGDFKDLEKRRTSGRSFTQKVGNLLTHTPLADRMVWEKARAGVLEKTGGHYPAPLVAIAIVRDGLELPIRRALDLEAGAFGELVLSDTAKNLISIFFRKNEVDARAGKLAQAAKGRNLETVAVLGAGFMGSGIAQVLAYRGTNVILKDRDLAAVARGLQFCGEQLRELKKRRKLTQPELQLAMARLRGTDSYAGFQRAGMVIEAVFEDVAVKHQVIREVEALIPEDAVFASNTSAIPITRLAEASVRPQNFVGMHFFSPVHKMPLLEIIRHPGTSPEALAATVEIGRRMGKTVIVVNDGPGFFTSRVLGPFLNEAAWMLIEGARIDHVDTVMTRWGWPVGPFALLDEVGLDVARHVAEVVAPYLGDRLQPPPVFERMVASGRLGRKGGRGFYLYGQGPKRVDDEVYRLLDWEEAPFSPMGDTEIAERCWLQMLNETARCMEEGIVTDPADVDLGVLFGFGFPAFRGGLLREADRMGLPWVVDRLETYAAALDSRGSRLEPAPLLRDMARRGARFYSEGK